MTAHVYVDESERAAYLVAAAAVDSAQHAAVRALAGLDAAPRYIHLPAAAEPLLWCADAIAWAYGAGGDWRRRVDPLLMEVVDVPPGKRETRPPTVRRRAGSTSAS